MTKDVGGPYDRATDPSVAYDARHHVWMISSLAIKDPVGTVAVRRDIVVSRAHDQRAAATTIDVGGTIGSVGRGTPVWAISRWSTPTG